MIIILAYWLFLFSIFLPAGIMVKKACKLQTNNLYLLVLAGMFLCTVYFCVTAVFLPLNVYSLVFLLLSALITGVYTRHEIFFIIHKNIQRLAALPLLIRFLLCFLILGVLLRSAQLPFILDNESYYVQTIKWFNEYGFVKGLGNLHIFLAQASPWHVLQAGVNFSFITDRINDINGFVYIICISYYCSEIYKNSSNSKISWIGILPVYSVLLFLFIDSPSPDLPILMITHVIIYLFAETPEYDTDNIKIAILLFAFLAFIKITIAPLALLFLPNFISNKKNMVFFIMVGFATASVWIIKNSIITGYPFYPFNYFKLDVDWTIPGEILKNISELTIKHGYYKGAPANGDDTIAVKLLSWFQLPGLAGILNKVILLLFIITPFFNIIRKNKRYLIVYIVFLIHFVLLLLTSPQFRFFLPEIMFFSVIIIAEIYNRNNVFKKLCPALLVISAASIIVLFFNVTGTMLTKNKFHQSTGGGTRISHLYLPEKNTRFSSMTYEQVRTGNLTYYSPAQNFFFYGTANGPLPCVNKVQIEYYSKKFDFIPQLRGSELSNGFYSRSISNDQE